MAEWSREPVAGSSPETEPTVITGADPWAVLPLLGVATPARDQYLWACSFVYRGVEVHLGDMHLSKGARPEQQIDTSGTRPVLHDRLGDEAVYYADRGSRQLRCGRIGFHHDGQPLLHPESASL